MDLFDKINFTKYYYGSIEFKEEIGSGANSTVYRCRVDGKTLAVKEYKTNRWDDINQFYDDFNYELNVANKTQGCKRIIKTYGISKKNHNVYLLMEYLGENDLYDYLQTNCYWKACYKYNNIISPEPENEYTIYNEDQDIYWNFTMNKGIKLKNSLKLLESLKELHDRCIVHGDIKSNNIGRVGPPSGTIKLIDLGSSTVMEEKDIVKIDGKYGTEGYMAPEQYNFWIGYKSDVYSVAVVLVEIWCGDIWENGTGYKPCRNEVLKCVRKMEKTNDKQMHEYTTLLRKCLSPDMSLRPNADKFLKKFLGIF
jgi:serine/threonine protein kinase